MAFLRTEVSGPWDRPGRRAAIRIVGLAGGLAAALAVSDARAARVTVSGAGSCVEAEGIAEQASDLLGRPLASVPGVDFVVDLRRAEAGRWRMRLDTIDVDRTDAAPGTLGRRSRELAAASCAELADAAAVGIAMSVRALAADEPAAQRPSPPRNTQPLVSPPAVVARAPAAERAATATPTLAGRLAVTGDAGALPGATAGVGLGVLLRLRRVWFGLAGTALAPRTAHAGGDTGGEVRLVYGAAETCLPAALGRGMTLLGCAGFELGRLSAEGIGISRPRLGSALWQTVRAEVGLSIGLAPRLAVVLRAGAAVPLSRPQFVIDGTTPVHRPSSLVARASTGVELEF